MNFQNECTFMNPTLKCVAYVWGARGINSLEEAHVRFGTSVKHFALCQDVRLAAKASHGLDPAYERRAKLCFGASEFVLGRSLRDQLSDLFVHDFFDALRVGIRGHGRPHDEEASEFALPHERCNIGCSLLFVYETFVET